MNIPIEEYVGVVFLRENEGVPQVLLLQEPKNRKLVLPGCVIKKLPGNRRITQADINCATRRVGIVAKDPEPVLYCVRFDFRRVSLEVRELFGAEECLHKPERNDAFFVAFSWEGTLETKATGGFSAPRWVTINLDLFRPGHLAPSQVEGLATAIRVAAKRSEAFYYFLKRNEKVLLDFAD